VKRDWLFWGILVTTALVGAGRQTVPSHGLSWSGTYEALSYIWIGAMLALAFDVPGHVRAFFAASALLVFFGRVQVPLHVPSWPVVYENMAHVWVGVMLALCFAGPFRRMAACFLVVATVFETGMFLLGLGG
jgi:hypothetical protein